MQPAIMANAHILPMYIEKLPNAGHHAGDRETRSLGSNADTRLRLPEPAMGCPSAMASLAVYAGPSNQFVQHNSTKIEYTRRCPGLT